MLQSDPHAVVGEEQEKTIFNIYLTYNWHGAESWRHKYATFSISG